MPLFSVVIPSYNRLSTLREAIASVQQQTFKDFDCWVVDDASTDGTWEWLNQARLGPSFHLLRNETNRRQHHCRNRAIQQSTAAWIAFLDSDDVWRPERLQRFADAIKSSPETSFWFSNGYWLENGKVVGSFFEEGRAIPTGVLPGYYAVGNRYLPYVTTNLTIRRDCFLRVGLYREDMQILEDTELYARMLKAGCPVGVIREKLSLYRLHPDQITRNYTLQLRETLMALDAADAGPDIKNRLHRLLTRDAAYFLLKAGRPAEARALIDAQDLRGLLLSAWLLGLFPSFVWNSVRVLFRALKPRALAKPGPDSLAAESWYRSLRDSIR